jgi:hypothetical protein
LTDAYHERDELTKEASTAMSESKAATERYQKWEHGFLMKRLFKNSFSSRKETAETALAKLQELQEQLRLTTIATEISVDREQAEPYYRMRDTFAALSESQKVWNVLAEKAIDRIAERTNANTAVTRTPVSFSLSSCDLIQWDRMVPHLPNRTGGDMYIYPGFILYRASKQAFALIDFRDVTLRFVSTQFTESEPVPSDSQIVGRTWAKCNKDGSPDRRFRDNYQIPIAHYGTLLFGSRDGLDVRYICSDARSAEQFFKTWTAFLVSLDSDVPQQVHDRFPLVGSQEESPNRIAQWRGASDKSTSAFETFTTAQDKILAAIAKVVQQHADDPASPGGPLSGEDVDSYMACLTELIKADAKLEKLLDLLPHSERTTFRHAIQAAELHKLQFEASISQKQMDFEKLKSFLDAINAFMQARSDFFKANTEALRRSYGEHS